MNQCDQPHAVSESTPSLHIFKNSPLRLEIPSRPVSIMNSSPTSDHLSPLSADGNESNIDHITCLERSLCSNFFCCGSQLPDLHALLEHFEEDHIMVLAPNGKRVYPREGLRSVPLHTIQSAFTTPTPSSSRSSSVAPSSSSSTPSTPSDFSSPSSGPFASRKSSLTAVTPVYTPFTPSLPVDPADPYPNTDEIIMQHDPRIYGFPDENYPTLLAAPFESITPPSSSDEDEEMSDCSALDPPGSPAPTYVYATGQIQPITAIPKRVKFANISPRGRPPSKSLETQSTSHSLMHSKSKNKSRHSTSASILSTRRREKSFRCPTPRCTKSYLNPNGLKYHMEKGTCNIEGEDESVPVATTTSSSNTTTPPSSALLPDGNTPVSGSNTHPHIQPHPGPIQDVEMQTNATTSDASGTHYLNSTAPTPVPTTGLPKTDIDMNNDVDVDVESEAETKAANRTTAGTDSKFDPKSDYASQQQESKSPHGPYYRHRPSADISSVSTSISISSATSPKVNPKGNEHEIDPSRHRTSQGAEPHSRVAAPAPTGATPRQQQQQQQVAYHYPVPSYPQLGGPNALLAGYTTFIHRPYFAADRSSTTATTADHSLVYSPIPLLGASNSSRLQ